MSAVIVLNTDNTALHTVSIKHAIRMLVREVAIVEEARDGHHIGPYPWPLVLATDPLRQDDFPVRPNARLVQAWSAAS